MNITIPHVTINITIEKVVTDSPASDRKLDELIEAVAKLGVQLMAISQQMKDVLDAIDNETTTIAAELQALRDQIAAGMTADEAASVQARLTAISDRLTGVAADPNNPVPAPPPNSGPASDPTVTP